MGKMQGEAGAAADARTRMRAKLEAFDVQFNSIGNHAHK
jgi:hypothetical protein